MEEIRQAYHRLVQEHLDDEAVFADLKEAYEVLTTSSRRADYDRAAWGETFDSPTASADAGLSPSGRCPMGPEAQCPVLQSRAAPTDKYCPDCGFGLAALSSGATFDRLAESDILTQARLEERGGQMHRLRPGVNIVGRENADVLLPDKTVSRNHARLELGETGSLSVEDLSSTNGTQVNEEALMPHAVRSLSDGDRLRFGSVFLTLHLPRPDLSEASADSDWNSDLTLPAAAGAQVVEIGEGSGRVFLLPAGITTFGRRPENTVVLTGDPYVSGSHAQIHADGDVFILTDIGSTNGTLLNGERLKINTPVTLDAGDVVVIGGTSLRFDRLGADAEDMSDEELDDEELEDEDLETETVPAERSSDEASSEEIQAEDAPGNVEG